MTKHTEPGGPRRPIGLRGPRARVALAVVLVLGIAWSIWNSAPEPIDVLPEIERSAERTLPGVDEREGSASAPEGDGASLELAALPKGMQMPPVGAMPVGPVDEGPEVGIRSPTGLYAGAKVEPLYDLRSDALAGVRVSRLREGSFWNLAGVREGDVILEVNGQLVDSPAASVVLLNSLAREPVLILRVRDERGDQRFVEYRSPLAP